MLTGVLLLVIRTLSRNLKSRILACLSNLSLDSNLDVFGSLGDCLHQKEDSFLFLKPYRMVNKSVDRVREFRSNESSW